VSALAATLRLRPLRFGLGLGALGLGLGGGLGGGLATATGGLATGSGLCAASSVSLYGAGGSLRPFSTKARSS